MTIDSHAMLKRGHERKTKPPLGLVNFKKLFWKSVTYFTTRGVKATGVTIAESGMIVAISPKSSAMRTATVISTLEKSSLGS